MTTEVLKRTTSQELTAVIPRASLPPISRRVLAAMELDPDHPETRDLESRAVEDEDAVRDDPRARPTLVPCPAGCRTCGCCHGSCMVTSEEAAAWRIAQVDAKNETEES